MKIAFDFNPVIKNRFSGFYSFGVNLLKAFDHLPDEEKFILFHDRSNKHKAMKFMQDITSDKFELSCSPIKINWLKKIWNNIDFPKLQTLTGRFDVYHSFHNMMPPVGNVPRILTVHDLRRYCLPELYSKPVQPLFVRAIKSADHIIAVSEATKNDIIKVFNIAEDKISVVYLACEKHLAPLSEQAKEEGLNAIFSGYSSPPSKYLITLSSPDSRKNILRTVKAFNKISGKHKNVKLLIVGLPPKNKEEFEQIQAMLSANENIIMTGPVEDIHQYIACSSGLLFPSLYEGFGIPVLEAFALNVPLLAANCTSLPEIGADGAIYVDPWDIDSIAAGMEQILEGDLTEMRLAAKRRLEMFSWEKSALQVRDVYKKLI